MPKKNMKKINYYKIILIIITLTIILLIVIFTIDVITETKNPIPFDIDFENKNNIVSAYGTLIGGILAFLSILFVLFGLLEQRQIISNENILKEKEYKEELLDKLKLLSSYFNSTIIDLKKQGAILNKYSIQEQESPSEMNRMLFTSNRNFTRIIDMDPLSIYKAMRINFITNKNWENTYLNIYSIFDFYSQGLQELKHKYESQIRFKVKQQRKITFKIRELLNECTKLTDEYKIESPDDYLNKEWVIFINEFTKRYYDYLTNCKKNNEVTNLRIVSDSLLLPFLNNLEVLRNNPGLEKPICQKIIMTSSNIRKDISEIEFHCVYYAKDIEKQFKEYFSDDNEQINELKKIKKQIDDITSK
jgi:hypothetical protein